MDKDTRYPGYHSDGVIGAREHKRSLLPFDYKLNDVLKLFFERYQDLDFSDSQNIEYMKRKIIMAFHNYDGACCTAGLFGECAD